MRVHAHAGWRLESAGPGKHTKQPMSLAATPAADDAEADVAGNECSPAAAAAAAAAGCSLEECSSG